MSEKHSGNLSTKSLFLRPVLGQIILYYIILYIILYYITLGRYSYAPSVKDKQEIQNRETKRINEHWLWTSLYRVNGISIFQRSLSSP